MNRQSDRWLDVPLNRRLDVLMDLCMHASLGKGMDSLLYVGCWMNGLIDWWIDGSLLCWFWRLIGIRMQRLIKAFHDYIYTYHKVCLYFLQAPSEYTQLYIDGEIWRFSGIWLTLVFVFKPFANSSIFIVLESVKIYFLMHKLCPSSYDLFCIGGHHFEIHMLHRFIEVCDTGRRRKRTGVVKIDVKEGKRGEKS